MMSKEISRMDIKEFREKGYLQEANRLFFHPLGLALEVVIDEETGSEAIGGIWDYREDPEGMVFDSVDGQKAVFVKSEELSRKEAREALMGSNIQPVDWVYEAP